MSTYADIAAVAFVGAATLGIGAYGLRISRTTSDFYVASRSVTPLWNASAISGEYLSAASFLGVAGLILAYGADMLWYPVGYAAGYFILLLFVAAPLRRSGAYTLPDFAEARLSSPAVRRISTVLVVLIGWLYLVPQLQGAGLTLKTTTGAPIWAGGLLVTVVVLANVLAGGMRSVTLVQAFQYWLKLVALTVPMIFILIAWHSQGSPSPTGTTYPTLRQAETVTAPNDLVIEVAATIVVVAHGAVDGSAVSGSVQLSSGQHEVTSGTRLSLSAGQVVPQAQDASTLRNARWVTPLTSAVGGDHPLYSTYSLVLATFLGTMGLPHVLVRFYTNPDGHAARRTTLVVLLLLSGFYLLPTLYGALARLYTPDVLTTGNTDTAVLLLPSRLVPGTGGTILSALVTAGAFAAFLSTSSGLTVSVAGAFAQRTRATTGAIRDFRFATVVAISVPFVLSLLAADLPVAAVVGLAFAVAASSFCPLLLLGIWWPRLTDVGAAAGLILGGGLATAAVLTTVIARPSHGWVAALLAQPAAWCVPLSFAAMMIGSWLTSPRASTGVVRVLARMHTPESVWPEHA